MKKIDINRMKELTKSFDNKNEIIKEEKSKNIDSDKIQKEADRLKKIAMMSEIANPAIFSTNPRQVRGVGQTVEDFPGLNVSEQTPGMGKEMNINKVFNPNYTYLQPNEALKVAINRVINSGSPVNNMDFYTEINWNLNNMGFNSRAAIDIKSTLIKMLAS